MYSKPEVLLQGSAMESIQGTAKSGCVEENGEPRSNGCAYEADE
jgi:hypothetical protein